MSKNINTARSGILPTKAFRVFLHAGLAVGFLVVSLILIEGMRRVLDNYCILCMQLVKAHRGPEVQLAGGASAPELLGSLPVAKSVPKGLFYTSPQALPRRATPVNLKKRAAGSNDNGVKQNRVWNEAFLSDTSADYMRILKEPIFVFDPPNGALYPRYRFYPNVTLPSGLTVNKMGWRGRDYTLQKKKTVIRIAALGDSTTSHLHRIVRGYTEYIEYWLNAWAGQNGYDVEFEVFNTGRETISAADVLGILKHELLPFSIDYAFLYGMGNDFPFKKHLEKIETSVAASSNKIEQSKSDQDFAWLRPWSHRVAIVERIFSYLAGLSGRDKNGVKVFEESGHRLVFPDSFNQQKFALDDAKNILELEKIFKEFDQIKEFTDEHSITFILSSFVRLGGGGVVFDREKHSSIIQYYRDILKPLTPEQSHTLTFIQNKFYRLWAMDRNVPFVDLARIMPQNPDLFIDSIHNNELGIKIRAWSIFNLLVPLIQNDLRKGRLPRPRTSSESASMPFPKVREVTWSTIKQLRSRRIDALIARGQLFLSSEISPVMMTLAYDKARLEKNDEEVTITTAAEPYAYAAEAVIHDDIPISAKQLLLRIRMRVEEGAVQVAVLSKDRQRLLKMKHVSRGDKGATDEVVIISVDDPSEAGFLMFSNYQHNLEKRSTVVFLGAEVLADAPKKIGAPIRRGANIAHAKIQKSGPESKFKAAEVDGTLDLAYQPLSIWNITKGVTRTVTDNRVELIGPKKNYWYLAVSPSIKIERGRNYKLVLNCESERGNLSVNILDESHDKFISQFPVREGNKCDDPMLFKSGKSERVKIIITNSDPEGEINLEFGTKINFKQ